MSEATAVSDSTREALLAEYGECFNNFAYRDQLIPSEFQIALGIITGMVAVLEALSESLGFWGILIIQLTGLLALIVLHFDLMSNASSKSAAIKRAAEIEQELGAAELVPARKLQLASRIGKRRRLWGEMVGGKAVRASILIIWFVRLLIAAWIAYAIVTLGSYSSHTWSPHFI